MQLALSINLSPGAIAYTEFGFGADSSLTRHPILQSFYTLGQYYSPVLKKSLQPQSFGSVISRDFGPVDPPKLN
jgi:hypothetical protein